MEALVTNPPGRPAFTWTVHAMTLLEGARVAGDPPSHVAAALVVRRDGMRHVIDARRHTDHGRRRPSAETVRRKLLSLYREAD
jgi:hypothetical protein